MPPETATGGTSNEAMVMEAYDTEELEIYDTKRPKHIVDGVAKGTGNILKGAVGGVALMLGAPVKGAYDGAKEGGTVGALKGFGLGLGAGLVGGAAMAVGGVLTGTMQVSLSAEGGVHSLAWNLDRKRHHLHTGSDSGLTQRQELRRGVPGVDRVQPRRGGCDSRREGRRLSGLSPRSQPIRRRHLQDGARAPLGQVRTPFH